MKKTLIGLNKAFDVEVPSRDGLPIVKTMTWRDVYKGYVENIPRDGFTVENMTERLDVMEKLNADVTSDTLDLETAEMERLAEWAKTMRYAVLHREYIAARKSLDAINNAEGHK